jgi:hypothetical protein
MTGNRRQATDADLTVGAIVYKGSGSVAWEIWTVLPANDLHPVYCALRKPSSKSQSASRYYAAEDLQVSISQEPTGIGTLRELLTLDF